MIDARPDSISDESLVVALLAVAPAALGGAWVRSGAGPVRDRLVETLRMSMPPGSPWRRLPAHIDDERLLGGLDFSATLSAGRRVLQRGVLALCDGGTVVIPMAERLGVGTAARIASVLDRGEVALEREGLGASLTTRFAVLALDEGDGNDAPVPTTLTDRLAFRFELPPHDRDRPLGVVDPGVIEAARQRWADIVVTDECLTALCLTAEALGVDSLRALWFAQAAARAHAALVGAPTTAESSAAVAARLVLAPRATRLPPQRDEDPPEPPPSADDPPPAEEPPAAETQGTLEDRVVAAAAAAIPAGLLALLRDSMKAPSRANAGRAGAAAARAARGRPIGVHPGMPKGGVPLDLVATLRAAAPWQRVRRRLDPRPLKTVLRLSRDDLRVRRYLSRSETTTIFLVDASGSTALNRLSEAKGAVELLLADCYVRRDRVAVVAFRGTGAELVLPPTRSLVRAKRSLAGLPGGGGSPLAAGLATGLSLVDAIVRSGGTPTLVVLTDGRANIARDGTPGRARAETEAVQVARQIALCGARALLIDIAPRSQPFASQLAGSMRATYLALPHAGAETLNQAVRAATAARA